jgi:tyrosine-protein phosphatase SIW14
MSKLQMVTAAIFKSLLPWQRYNFLASLFLVIFFVSGCVTEKATIRPAEWATPVNGTEVKNFYKVTEDVYRSAQPEAENASVLKNAGIKSILNLRHYHKDSETFTTAGIKLYNYQMDASSASLKDLVEALKIVHTAPKPILIHCHFGRDRTGFIIAGYRMVMTGWTAEKAIDELRHGGYGYHESEFPDIMQILQTMDVKSVKNAVLTPDATATSGNCDSNR